MGHSTMNTCYHRPAARLVLSALGTLALACGKAEPSPEAAAEVLPTWMFDSSMVFPRDGSLMRAEDGVLLADGRLLVADQAAGLRLVETDGTSRPFGDLPGAGYAHHPPAHPGGANGVSLEPGGAHALVADVFGGAIYRVDVATGATEKVYQHTYGINTAVRDSKGAIWFTQSAMNTPEEGEARMWAAVDTPRPEGALLRLPTGDGKPAATADVVVDSLWFGNGVAIDEANGKLYVAETVGGRVLRYDVDLAAGTLTNRTVFVDSVAADNLELDGAGHLWVAAPLSNEILVVHTATGMRHVAFRSQTAEQAAILAEFMRRGTVNEPRVGMISPALWSPLPGPSTGMILGGPNDPVYITGLGNALVRLPR
jgi:sugar lactone lactonase YvrE